MSDDEIDASLFEEPEGFRPPPPESHFAEFVREYAQNPPKTLKLKLVGKSPLWGHLLWNAGKFTANYLDMNAKELVEDKRVLELGAAAALPTLICAVNGAKDVVSTDYPDPELMTHIQYNIDHCEGIPEKTKTKVKGYIWGQDVNKICYEDLQDEDDLPEVIAEENKFDLVILSDLIFNHTEHLKLLKACRDLMKKTGVALVVFTPHRAHLLPKDLEFFETAKQFQFDSEKVDQVTWSPMFDEDEETKEVRSRVYCYKLHPRW